MSEFTRHTRESAPPESREIMDAVEKKFGLVPNLIGHLAEAPKAAKAYVTLDGLFSETSLTPREREVVRITVSVENGCHYCVPAHTAVGLQAGLDEESVSALRDGEDPSDPRLAALSRFVRSLVRNRGQVSDDELQGLLDAGFERSQVIEILVGVAQKTLSNYGNALFGTEVDEPFSQFAWEKGEPAATVAAD